MTREEYEERIRQLEEVNQELLEGHSRMSIAYLNQRINVLADGVAELTKRLNSAGKIIRDLQRKVKDD